MAIAGSLDYFIRSIWQGGQGVAEAMRSIGGLGQSAKQTDLQMAVARRNTLDYNKAMRVLAKEVTAGGISMEAAEQKAKGLAEKFGQVDGAGRKSGFRFMEMKAKLDLVTQGLGAAQDVFAKTWKAVGEGAQLELASARFDKLTASVGTTSDSILGQFRSATGGMMSNAEMIASASQIISLGLADNETDIVRLGNVVGQLGLDMQQVIMTFANDSKARLDALGLSVTDVEKRTKEYTDAGIAASKAFDMAVLDALEAKLELVGSAAGTTAGSMARLEASWANLTDTGKLWLAQRWEGPIVGLSESMDAVGEATDKGHSKLRNFAVIMNEVSKEMGGIPADTFIDWLFKTESQTAATVEQLQAYSDRIQSVNEGVRGGVQIRAEAAAAARVLTEITGEEREAMAEAGQAANDFAGYTENLTRHQLLYVTQSKIAREITEGQREEMIAAGQAANDFAGYEGDLTRAQLLYVTQTKIASQVTSELGGVMAGASEETAKFFNQLASNEELAADYASILGGVSAATVSVGGRTAEQSEELARLQGIYDRTQQSIRDYEAGIKGAGLSEEARAKKLEDLNATLANTQAAMNPLMAITSEYSSIMVEAEPNIDLLNQKLFEQIQANSDNAAAIALAGQELGIYTEAEAEALLKAALLEEAIRQQAGTWDGSAESLRNIQGNLQQYIDTLNNVPSLIQTEVQTNYTATGAPGGWAPGIPEGFSRGGLVRGGVPGRDSVPAMLMPGERVLTVSQNRDWESGRAGGWSGGGGDTYIINTVDRTDIAVDRMARRRREQRWTR